MTNDEKPFEVQRMKNLKHLYYGRYTRIYIGFLSYLQKLKEIHLTKSYEAEDLFKTRQIYGRTELKIYLNGLLLNDADDPAIFDLCNFNQGGLDCLAENPSRLADEIPFCDSLEYRAIERVAPELQANLLNRCIYLFEIILLDPVQDTQRFLDLLKSLDHIVKLWFVGDQPQELFDRLPEYYAAQNLEFSHGPSDLAFLARLEDLLYLEMRCSIDAQTIRKVLEELKFLSFFSFEYRKKLVRIQINHPKLLKVRIGWEEETEVLDLETAIQLITGNTDN